VDPYLQDTLFQEQVRVLTGFAAQCRTGFYGRGKQVQSGTVSTAVTSIGQTITLATNLNPTKVHASDKLLPRIKQMLDGWEKVDPAKGEKTACRG